MPQCVAFDYFGVDCDKKSLLKVTRSARGRCVALGPPEKAGADILRQLLGHQNYSLTTAYVVNC